MSMTHLLAWTIGIWEVAIILAVVLLLFGASNIPKLMRGLGSGVSEFKKGLKEGEGDSPKPPEPPAPK